MQKIILILIIFIFTGCVQDRSFGIFTRDKIYQKSIKNTQKGDIINLNKTKAVVIASYLNIIYDDFKDNEYFYIGVYINDENSNKIIKLKDINYSLTLNGLKPISIEKREKDDKFKKDLPFINNWFDYYIVEFKESKTKELNLSFNYHNFGDTELKFIK